MLQAVTEVERDMDAGIFSGADQDAVKQYMPRGTAPSTISSFVLKVGDEFILFDAGLGSPAWVKGIDELGIDPAKVKTVILTHMHGDHIGGLLDGDKARFPNAEIRVSKLEFEFWYGRKDGVAKPSPKHETIQAVYGDALTTKTFDYGDIIASKFDVAVKALDAHGHTPGHAAFLIEDPKKKVLVIGDLLHAAALQFPAPQCNARYDVNPENAAESRRRLLDMAAEQNLPVAGMHLPKPSVGTVKKDGTGYVWTPVK